MVFCIIPGCGNTSTRDKGVYSRVPKIVTHCGHQQEEITTRRRTLWLDAIARPDLNENIILSERVCFRHFISGKPAASWDQNNPDWIPNQNLSTQEMHLTSLSADCDDNIRPSKRSQNTPSPAKRAQSRSKPSPGKRAKTKISLSQDDEYAENLPSPEPGSPSESEPLHLKCEQIENEDSFPSQSERFQCIPLLAEIAQQSHIVSFIDEHKVGEVKMVEEENKSEKRCSAPWASTRSRGATPNLVSILKQRPSQNSPSLTPQHSKRNKSTSLLVLPQQQKQQFQKSFVLPGKSFLPPMLQYQIFNKRFSSPVTPLKFECCVPFCKNNSYDGPGRFLSFHGFPNDPIIRKKWIASIRKDDDESFEVLSSTKVCSDHFLPNEIVLSETGRRKIKTGCVPHIFMWNLDVDCDEVSPAKSYDWSPRLGTPDDGDPSDLESSHQTTFEDNSKENEGFGNSESTSEFMPVIVKTEQVDDDYYEEHGVNNQTNDVENHFSDVAVKMECVPDEMDSTEQQLPTVLEEHQPPPAFVFNTQRCLDLCKSLFNFYENGIFCDTIVITKNKQLQAHSIVMAAWSPFCLSILNSKRVAGACIIDLSTFDSDTVETVLNYMYTGELRMFENKMKVDQFSKLYALMKTLGLPFKKANGCSNKVVQSIEINNVPEVTGIHKNRTNNMSDDRSSPRFLTKMNKSVQPGDQEMAHDDSTERNLRKRNKKPLLKIKLSAKRLQVVDDVDNVNKIKSHKVQNSRFESRSPVPDDGNEPADVEPSAEFEVIDDVDEKQTFHCQYCGISCTTLFDLNDHYENFHSNTPLLACSVCKQLFQKQSHMKAHMRWKHGMVYKPSKEILKYLCDLCGSNFRRVSNLKRHYLTNHPDSKPYVCEVCRKCFRLFHQLKIHLRIHTKERPYQCQYCPKTFRTISNRQIHHHTHAAKKPYECTTCSKGFAVKVNWKIHMKKKHNING